MRLRFNWLRLSVPLSAVTLAIAACTASGAGHDRDFDGSALDSDGNGIPDGIEGGGDPDGDGIANSIDEDDDGDGIRDKVEIGPTPSTPRDSDEDGTPDFRDADSDGNGLLDSDEGVDDTDEDGTADYADADNDGDGILDDVEVVGARADCDKSGQPDPLGTTEKPKDCDGDKVPDYLDTDTDGDGLDDGSEAEGDTDGDGSLDRYDLDSDNDGIPDGTEKAVDTDGDGIPDFRDLDSDNDGITDQVEIANGGDPTVQDTDGDGVTDLIEITAGTDPADPLDNPRARGDFVFIVPYQEPTQPVQDTIQFSTSIQYADVYFAFDTTGSMDAELEAMNNPSTGVPAIVNELRCRSTGVACSLDSDCGMAEVCFSGACITDPLIGAGCIPDLWTGVGTFDDLNTYTNRLSLQPNPVTTAGAVPAFSSGGGAEAPFQPSVCIANPAACPNADSMNCAGVGVGCPGFRLDAVRIYVQITDADDQCEGSECSSFTPARAGTALQAANIRFVSLYGTDDDNGEGTAESVATQIARASNTVDTAGNPFVYLAVDSAVVTNAVTAIRSIAHGKELDVTVRASDDASDTVDATQFIDFLEANVSGDGNCTAVEQVIDTNEDAHNDSFPELLPGVPVCWDVHPVLQNTTVEPTDEPQLYKAVITVSGDGSPLDDRDVYFLIPPKGVIINPPN